MDKAHKYMGYRQNDYTTPYARFYSETIAPVPNHVTTALQQSPFEPGILPPLSRVTDMMQEGYREVETGFTLEPDGSAQLAILTPMPNVAPYMWDWWFSWHGRHANRYKLWHPKCHRSAEWKDGEGDTGQYVGRTSMIEEYIGKRMEKAFIRFLSPVELGLDSETLENKEKVVFICARIGFTQFPIDFGWLVHQVRATDEGSEMRSRFWIGGRYVHLRVNGSLPKLLNPLLQKVARMSKQQAIDLLIHCAEEMNHLAAFLPQLYAEFKR